MYEFKTRAKRFSPVVPRSLMEANISREEVIAETNSLQDRHPPGHYQILTEERLSDDWGGA